jgi:hypothetical protein
MIYAQVIEEEIIQVVGEQSLRELYPSTHFPSPILQSHLEGFDNWYVVQDDQTIPEYDKATKKILFTREWNAGAVKGSYKVLNLTNAEKAEAEDAAWNTARYNRDNMLRATDYLMLTDVYSKFDLADKEKISNFRQALRDITDQTNAFNIEYPTLDIPSIKLPDLLRS